MSSDAISRALSKFGDYDESEAFEVFKASFVLKPVQARIDDLLSAEKYFEEHLAEKTAPTKELSSLLTKKRELEGLHRRLRELNR
jgi:hypothetical protein